MDGERKKRKMENDEEDEGDEQKSVEKFFALIRSTKEARDRLLSHGDHAKKGAEEGKTEKEEIGAWTPTFQLEDFMDGSHGKAVKNFPVIEAGPSQRKEEEEKQETKLGTGGSGLDLNLSL